MELSLKANLGPLIAKWQAKEVGVRAIAFLGAVQIATFTNAEEIPVYFPGRVAEAVHTEARVGEGRVLASVRGVVDNPLFYWYVKGTRPHPIYPVVARALAFDWEKFGGAHVIFSHVSHPGAIDHGQDYAEFLTAFRDVAYETWRDELLAFLLA